ncbi:hypothetical protein F5B19DRAFT_352220 [Rostrohypoxylon terebratum]|nr:hypothetical protein F5B19DRAFT_352220 [Rostrohypoxylon terebratum]
MAENNLSRKIAFLTDAAHLLIQTAPETSAYLMMQQDSLIFQNDLERPDMQRQHVCGACGHIMVPGQGSELKLEASKAARRRNRAKIINITSKSQVKKKEKEMPTSECRKRFTCGMCGRYTDVSIPLAAPISRRHLPKLTKPEAPGVSRPDKPVPIPVVGPAKASANASSKKRAKSRKQGLQALLKQAQTSTSQARDGLGLSLSDFMLK